MLNGILRQERDMYVVPLQIALVLHALGRDDEALQQLRRGVDARDPSMTFLGVDPKWDALRSSPAFQAVLSRVNLLDVSNHVLGRR